MFLLNKKTKQINYFIHSPKKFKFYDQFFNNSFVKMQNLNKKKFFTLKIKIAINKLILNYQIDRKIQKNHKD